MFKSKSKISFFFFRFFNILLICQILYLCLDVSNVTALATSKESKDQKEDLVQESTVTKTAKEVDDESNNILKESSNKPKAENLASTQNNPEIKTVELDLKVPDLQSSQNKQFEESPSDRQKTTNQNQKSIKIIKSSKKYSSATTSKSQTSNTAAVLKLNFTNFCHNFITKFQTYDNNFCSIDHPSEEQRKANEDKIVKETSITEEDQIKEANIESFKKWKVNGTPNGNGEQDDKSGQSLNGNGNVTKAGNGKQNDTSNTKTKSENGQDKAKIEHTIKNGNTKSDASTQKSQEDKKEKQAQNENRNDPNDNKSSDQIVSSDKSDKNTQKKPTNGDLLENYALSKCGAKITAHSSGLENYKAVINDDQDTYMKNLCSDEKVAITIELCEPIIIREFHIANYEPFSSNPKTIQIEVSETENGKYIEYELQQNENTGNKIIASDKHQLQKFQIRPKAAANKNIQNNLYRFVKITIHDHYGNEFFCPISYIGVWGHNWLKSLDIKEAPIVEPVKPAKVHVNNESNEIPEQKELKKDEKLDNIASLDEKSLKNQDQAADKQPGLIKKIINTINPNKENAKTDPDVQNDMKNGPVTGNLQLNEQDILGSFGPEDFSSNITDVSCVTEFIFRIETGESCGSAKGYYNVKAEKENQAIESVVIDSNDASAESDSHHDVDDEPTHIHVEAEPEPEPTKTKFQNLPIENMVMILNNKLSSFQTEMNETNLYLEELSEQYKSQMDNIRSVHNRTLGRLIKHIEKSENTSTKFTKNLELVESGLKDEVTTVGKELSNVRRRITKLEKLLRRNQQQVGLIKVGQKEKVKEIFQEVYEGSGLNFGKVKGCKGEEGKHDNKNPITTTATTTEATTTTFISPEIEESNDKLVLLIFSNVLAAFIVQVFVKIFRYFVGLILRIFDKILAKFKWEQGAEKVADPVSSSSQQETINGLLGRIEKLEMRLKDRVLWYFDTICNIIDVGYSLVSYQKIHHNHLFPHKTRRQLLRTALKLKKFQHLLLDQ